MASSSEFWASDPLAPVRLRVHPIRQIENVSPGVDDGVTYAWLIATAGYEARSRFVAETIGRTCGQISAYTFESHHSIDYERNLQFYESVGVVVDEPEELYRKLIAEELRAHASSWIQSELVRSGGRKSPTPLRVAVDISSMTRARIAETLLAVFVDAGIAVDVDWLYAPAKYSKATGAEGPIRTNEPVNGFEGWGDPSRGLACIVGAGFEGDLALGILDDLEPTDTWVFRPTGFIQKYDTELLSRNVRLFDSLADDRIIDYAPDQPYHTLLQLESLCSELTLRNRVVMLPLGPKIFALLSFLIGLSNRRDVVVWRLSADFNRVPTNRIAQGSIVGLRVASVSPRTEQATIRLGAGEIL
jgi:hypothetical protein